MSTNFPGQSGSGSSDNEEILHISKSSGTGASQSNYLLSYQDSGVLSYSQYIPQSQLTGLFITK